VCVCFFPLICLTYFDLAHIFWKPISSEMASRTRKHVVQGFCQFGNLLDQWSLLLLWSHVSEGQVVPSLHRWTCHHKREDCFFPSLRLQAYDHIRHMAIFFIILMSLMIFTSDHLSCIGTVWTSNHQINPRRIEEQKQNLRMTKAMFLRK